MVPKYILAALSLGLIKGEDSIWDELRECAKETLPSLVRHELSEYANRLLVSAIDIKTDPRLEQQASAMSESIARSIEKISSVQENHLSRHALLTKEEEIRAKYIQSISDGSWTKVFRGRDVLKRFVARSSTTASYEVFRNLLLAQMRDDSYRPGGMKEIVDAILAS
ncbi:MAG: hypothetical protein U0411_11545 [Thermodesulfovibrionales bacterium]